MPTTRRIRRIRTALLATVAAATFGACATETPTPTPSAAPTTGARPTVDVDATFAVAGGRLHLRCVGEGPTTVVLVAGWGDGGESWAAVEQDLGDRARVCSYAKFGTGTSDPAPTDQTFATQAEALDDLLHAADEPGPYVVAGHSFGGATAVAFAARHATSGDVDGLVLVDATPTDWITASCAVPADGSATAALFQATCAMASDPAANPERLDAAQGFADLAAEVTTLGGLPMRVLVPSLPTAYDDLTPAAAERLRAVKAEGTERWAALSTGSRIVRVDGTGHTIQVDRPDAVVEAVTELLG